MLPEVKNLFRPLTLLIVILHAVYMLAGCGADDDIEEKVLPVKIVSVDPPSGNTIAVDAIITATFDGVPSDVIVSSGVATVAGKTLTIAGPFTQGTFILTITWSDGTQAFMYTVPNTEASKDYRWHYKRWEEKQALLLGQLTARRILRLSLTKKLLDTSHYKPRTAKMSVGWDRSRGLKR